MDDPNRRGPVTLRDLLGDVMTAKTNQPGTYDVVALLSDRPADNLARGQVGTVVEPLDEKTVLVEFCDDRGRAYAIVACNKTDLILLHYVPQAA